MACVRKVWLDLYGDGTQVLLLENPAQGYFCTQLDLGFPTVRQVISDNPGRDGAQDRTQFMGPRVVSANITALAGAGASIDLVATSFAPYMSPAARPVLHYVLDRPGSPERTLVVRASGYAWPVAGDQQRDLQLQWVAADPTCWDPAVHTATAWSGASVIVGRSYPLVFNRVYPTGGATGPTAARIQTFGDLGVQPALTVHGPITGPRVGLDTGLSGQHYVIPFQPGFRIDANTFVTIDTADKTAYQGGDPGQPVMNQIDWLNANWPVIPVAPDYAMLGLAGTSTTSITQVTATWQDRYLT